MVAGRALGRGGDPEAVAEPEYIAQLEHPEGAVDKFHVAHPGEREIADWFADVGLELRDVERVDYAAGCFMRGVKPAA
jgi:hypothetical protein